MAKRLALLAALAFVFVVMPASAGIVYDNSPVLTTSLANCPGFSSPCQISSTTSNWVSDSFTVFANGTALGSVNVWLWTPDGTTTGLKLDYCISSTGTPPSLGTATNCGGTVWESGAASSGTAAALTAISGKLAGAFSGESLYEFSFNLSGTQGYQQGNYWLTLRTATGATGPIYWAMIDSSQHTCTGDQHGPPGSPVFTNPPGFVNGCPSAAAWPFQSDIGDQGNFTSNFSEAFQLNDTGSSTPPPSGSPEPATITLMGSGVLVIAGLLRKFRR